MEVSGKLLAPAVLLSGEKTLSTHCVGSWVGHRTCVDIMKKRNICCFCCEVNLIPQPSSLYSSIYTDYSVIAALIYRMFQKQLYSFETPMKFGMQVNSYEYGDGNRSLMLNLMNLTQDIQKQLSHAKNEINVCKTRKLCNKKVVSIGDYASRQQNGTDTPVCRGTSGM
jgi:hypothetical protein